jgi:Holliday junction resolvase RusA-like endonuclease
MRTVAFRVPGEARGKARPRVTRGGVHTYTPDPGGFVERVTAHAVEAGLQARADYEGAVEVSVLIGRAMPQGWSKKRRAQTEGEPCLVKPDSNNVLGAVLDALNRVAFIDDAQVYRVRAQKAWAYEHSVQVGITYSGT